MDIALAVVIDPDTFARSFDFQMDGHDLAADDGLQTAVALSLFLDRQAAKDDGIPGGGERRGWWASSYFADTGGRASAAAAQWGSRLWLLQGAPANIATARRAELYAHEALQWLIDAGIAASVAVRTKWVSRNELALFITLVQRNAAGVAATQAFDFIWGVTLGTQGTLGGRVRDRGTILGTEDGFEIGSETGQPLGE
jgi:phage gp46-like protein